jgi:uncharacterized protein (DUF58 family)
MTDPMTDLRSKSEGPGFGPGRSGRSAGFTRTSPFKESRASRGRGMPRPPTAPELRRLKLRARRRVDSLFAGDYLSAYKGRGIEFAEVREYQPGDDVRAIDWNVTARTGRPFIKEFVEERELTVMLALDLSASGRFGSGAALKVEALRETTAIIATVAADNNDRVGLLTFTDRIERFLAPSKGARHTSALLEAAIQSPPVGRGTDLPLAVTTLARTMRRRSVLFILSDFLVPSLPSLERPLGVLGRRHDVTALRLTDPRERDLPGVGLLSVEDPETGLRLTFDASSARMQRELREHFDRQAQQCAAICSKTGVQLADLSTDRPIVRDLARALRSRAAPGGQGGGRR